MEKANRKRLLQKGLGVRKNVLPDPANTLARLGSSHKANVLQALP